MINPRDIAKWSRDMPWTMDRDEIFSYHSGFFPLKSKSSGHMASYNHGKGIGITDQFFTMPEGTRASILYHEAGHGLESLFRPNELAELFGVSNAFDIIDMPGAKRFGYNYSEVLAEAYSIIWREPQWAAGFEGGKEILGAVHKMAKVKGFPIPPSFRMGVLGLHP